MASDRVLLVAAAMWCEIQPTLHGLGLVKKGLCYTKHIGETQVIAVVTGVGCQRTRRVLKEVVGQHGVDHILSVGFAGGLDPGLCVGDVVHVTSVTTPTSQPIELPPQTSLGEQLNPSNSDKANQHGTLLTVDHTINSPEEKRLLHDCFGCAVVDMEGYAVAELGREIGVRVDMLKVVSDPSTVRLPKGVGHWVTDDGRSKPWSAAWGLLVRPRDIPSVLRLGRHTALAAERIAQLVLGAIERR